RGDLLRRGPRLEEAQLRLRLLQPILRLLITLPRLIELGPRDAALRVEVLDVVQVLLRLRDGPARLLDLDLRLPPLLRAGAPPRLGQVTPGRIDAGLGTLHLGGGGPFLEPDTRL